MFQDIRFFFRLTPFLFVTVNLPLAVVSAWSQPISIHLISASNNDTHLKSAFCRFRPGLK